jgi:outer membrane protein assembly factor BamD (BamD/ComL family)
MHIRLVMAAILLAGVTGCAGMAQTDQQRHAQTADVRAKLSLGGCDTALAEQILPLRNPALEQEAAFACLQQGELRAVERLLGDYQTRHVDPPFPDYSAYLLALTDLVRFEAALGDDRERLAIGRNAHQALVQFVRAYPDSSYRSEVAPRLEQLLEGMARAEYQLAQLALETQARDQGIARMRYIVEQYPRSSAARDANRWLDHNQP